MLAGQGDSVMGAMQRNKGARIEREVVNDFLAAGIHAERVPLSGAVKGIRAGDGHDIDIYVEGREAPLCGEVKARRTFPKWITDMLGINDFLVLRANGRRPLFVVPERVMQELLKR